MCLPPQVLCSGSGGLKAGGAQGGFWEPSRGLGPLSTPQNTALMLDCAVLSKFAFKQSIAAEIESRDLVWRMRRGTDSWGGHSSQSQPSPRVAGTPSRDRSQRRRGGELGGIWRACQISGFPLREAGVLAAARSLFSPLHVPTLTRQTPHTHPPRWHKGTSHPRIWEAFPNSFAICSLSFLGKKKISQTSWEARVFMILRLSGFETPWLEGSRSWTFILILHLGGQTGLWALATWAAKPTLASGPPLCPLWPFQPVVGTQRQFQGELLAAGFWGEEFRGAPPLSPSRVWRRPVLQGCCCRQAHSGRSCQGTRPQCSPFFSGPKGPPFPLRPERPPRWGAAPGPGPQTLLLGPQVTADSASPGGAAGWAPAVRQAASRPISVWAA